MADKRRFIDAPADVRCEYTIFLGKAADDIAQCGRRKMRNVRYCRQHQNIFERNGNHERPGASPEPPTGEKNG